MFFFYCLFNWAGTKSISIEHPPLYDFVEHNAHFVEHNAHSVEHNAHFVEHNAHCVEHNAHFVVHNAHFVEHNAHYLYAKCQNPLRISAGQVRNIQGDSK